MRLISINRPVTFRIRVNVSADGKSVKKSKRREETALLFLDIINFRADGVGPVI